MERPVKRLKVSSPEARSPRQTGSQLAEGLFTSEMGIRSDDEDMKLLPCPSRTLSIIDLRRRNRPIYQPRQVLPRANEGILLRPRAPDATVTASVVDVQVQSGSTTVAATEVTLASASDNIVSVSDLGSVTVPAVSSATADSTLTSSDATEIISSDSSTITASSNSQSAVLSILSAALTENSTITSTESTVTITETSTFKITYSNGTFIPPKTESSHITAPSNVTTTTHRHTSTSPLFATPSSTGSSSDTSVNSSLSAPLTESPSTTSTYAAGFPPISSTTSSSSASSTAATTPAGPGLSPQQQTVVGGVVGGVAGIAVVLLILLMFLRWYRRRLKSQGRLPEQLRHNRDTSTGSGMEMMQSGRSSNIPLAAAVLKKWVRPHSGATFGTTSSSAPETPERGFQRIAGRKIAPVLGAQGGDGYGGNFGAFEKESATDQKSVERGLSRTSFYRDDRGFYAGSNTRASSTPGSPRTATAHSRGPSIARDFAEFPMPPVTPSSPLARFSKSEVNLGTARPEGFAMMRPSPARTPTSQSVDRAQVRMSMPPREERASAVEGLILDPDAPPTPSLPFDQAPDRGRLGVPGNEIRNRGDVSGSRGSGSRFREGVDV